MRTSPGSASRGKQPVRRQSEHLADYREALEKLSAQGLVYPSFESRAEIARLVAQREATAPWPRDPDGAPLYPGDGEIAVVRRARGDCSNRARPMRCGSTWRRHARAPAISAGREHGEGPDGETGAVAARPEAWGDVILARKETPTSYHLSVVIDDALQGVTRGGAGPGPVLVDQRAPAAAATAGLAGAGLPAPPPRSCDAAGQKLSKSTEATGLRELRAAGATPGRHPPPGRPALIAAGLPWARRKPKRLRRDSAARPWHGGPGQGQGNHGAKIALTAHHAAAEKAAAEKARCHRVPRPRPRKRAAVRRRARHGRGGARGVRA